MINGYFFALIIALFNFGAFLAMRLSFVSLNNDLRVMLDQHRDIRMRLEWLEAHVPITTRDMPR